MILCIPVYLHLWNKIPKIVVMFISKKSKTKIRKCAITICVNIIIFHIACALDLYLQMHVESNLYISRKKQIKQIAFNTFITFFCSLISSNTLSNICTNLKGYLQKNILMPVKNLKRLNIVSCITF